MKECQDFCEWQCVSELDNWQYEVPKVVLSAVALSFVNLRFLVFGSFNEQGFNLCVTRKAFLKTLLKPHKTKTV